MFKVGEKVKCVNVSESIQDFGLGDGIVSSLRVGNEYTVNDVESHSWHTLVWLDGVDGSFNDCLFEN
jgi:hypothetical protein